MPETKPAAKSKTILFNLLAIAVSVAGAFGFQGEVSPELQPYLPFIGPAIIAAINLVLRFVTKTPVTITGADEAE
jgi:uncharacterized membrane-anchored protein